MKAINAYVNLKKFSSAIEVIDTSLRIKKGDEQLLSVRDLFVTIEALNMIETLKTLAEYFKKKSVESKELEIKGMFSTWEELLFSKTESVNTLLSFSTIFKKVIDIQTSGAVVVVVEDSKREILQQGLNSMLKGIEMYVEDLKHIGMAAHIMDHFVIPEMSKEELQLEVENQNISLN